MTNNQIGYNTYIDYKNSVRKDANFDVIISFAKSDIHSVEDELKEITKEFSKKIPIMIVIEHSKFNVLDNLYNIGANYIFFDFKPEAVLEEIKKVIKIEEEKREAAATKDDYIINFYENKHTFIIDISGVLIKEKIKPLKLMFVNYLKEKLNVLKVIVYLFSNTDEKSVTFDNIWTLLRIWNELNIDYKKLVFLTTSENIKNEISKYFSTFGMRHFENLLEVVKVYYPELAKKDENAVFEFSSKLLESPTKAPKK